MATKRETKSMFKKADLSPAKHRGQNFLVSQKILDKIINSANINPGNNILEIGPGTGSLTQSLINAGADVIAVEKDRNLVTLLKSEVKSQKLKVIEGDILKFDETKIAEPYKVVANIPYYLTGKIIQKFTLSRNKPAEMILMVQKEVGERICAQPPQANFLSSMVQFMADTKVLFGVKKENFWPKPKVDSVIIKIVPYLTLPLSEPKKFIDFLKHAFKQPRQTLFNNLRKSNVTTADKLENLFKKLNFAKNIRPQNLNQQQLARLFYELRF